jgi:hypothetical protein
VSDVLYIVAALLLVAGLQGYNTSRIWRVEAECELMKKFLGMKDKNAGN